MTKQTYRVEELVERRIRRSALKAAMGLGRPNDRNFWFEHGGVGYCAGTKAYSTASNRSPGACFRISYQITKAFPGELRIELTTWIHARSWYRWETYRHVGTGKFYSLYSKHVFSQGVNTDLAVNLGPWKKHMRQLSRTMGFSLEINDGVCHR